MSQEDEKPETGGPSANRVLRPYRAQVAGVLAAAFTLSLAYSVVVTFTGSHEGYGMTDPALWVFYAVGYGLAALALTDRIWAWWATAAGVLALIAVGIFYYPTIFPPGAQTAFAWFENDVYVGLLILAEYLCVQRLRGVSLVPQTSRARATSISCPGPRSPGALTSFGPSAGPIDPVETLTRRRNR